NPLRIKSVNGVFALTFTFIRASGNRVRHDAVDTDACEEQGQHTKAAGERSEQPFPPQGAVNLLVLRAYVGDWQFPVQRPYSVANRSGQTSGIHDCLCLERCAITGGKLLVQ